VKPGRRGRWRSRRQLLRTQWSGRDDAEDEREGYGSDGSHGARF
jgi:hypothetical protein